MKGSTYWAMQHRATGQWYVTTNDSGAPVNGYAVVRARFDKPHYARWVAQALGSGYQLVRISNAKAKIARLESKLELALVELEIHRALVRDYERITRKAADATKGAK